MKKLIRKLVPKNLISLYHLCLAKISSAIYGFPSRKLIVIGVTGTKGKTSAINYIFSVLNEGGIKTGMITTANVKIGDKEMLNPFHMTMPGRFILQKFLKQMVYEKCEVAIVETTSQGIAQYRHAGIEYDVALFTNLTPEHIDAHGTFENYKRMKGKLFGALKSSIKKSFRGNKFPKTIIANMDSEHGEYFASFEAEKKIGFSTKTDTDYKAENIIANPSVSFFIKRDKYELSIPGAFNVWNALPAIVIGEMFGIERAEIASALKNLKVIPGRMEEIKNDRGYKVFVDYAHEKQSMTHVCSTGNAIKAEGGKLIILLGAEGGGRDKGKRKDMGEIVGKNADIVIVSNVDPYEDDPKEIVEDIARVAEANGKKRGANLFVIEDRRAGIAKALQIAGEGDVVIITGKGAEQSMIIGGKSIPWDDRNVVKEELQKIS